MHDSGPTAEHPDPLPAIGGEIETAHSIAKQRKRPPPKERNVSNTAMLRGSADEEVSTDTSGNADYESIEESLHATKSVQTDVCMADFYLYKEQQISVLFTKRLKFEAVIVYTAS